MLPSMKCLVAAASIAGVTLAHSTTVSSTLQDAGLVGSGMLTLDGSTPATASNDSLLSRLGVAAAISSYGAGTVTTTTDTDGYYTSSSAAMPLTSLTYDPGSFKISSVSFSGGFTWVATPRRTLTTGGTVTVTDFSIDFNSQTLFGTVIGANGVGTLTNQTLGQFNALSQTSGSPFEVSIVGISLSASFRQTIDSSLGLYSLGLTLFDGNPQAGAPPVTTLGNMDITLSSTAIDGPPPPWQVVSVPEPSTLALMALGVFAFGFIGRRKQVE